MAGCVWWSVLRAVYGSVVAWLFLPLMLILLMSVTDSPVVGLPIEHVTAHWYGAALADKDVRSAFLYSCTIAAASTTLALLVGLWTALAIDALHSTILRVAFIAAACLPIVTPGIVSAISLRMFILTIGIDPGYVAITLGHAIHATPFVIIVLAGRLRTVPPEQIEAARILGAGPVRAFLRVTALALSSRGRCGGAGITGEFRRFPTVVLSWRLSTHFAGAAVWQAVFRPVAGNQCDRFYSAVDDYLCWASRRAVGSTAEADLIACDFDWLAWAGE